MSPRRCHSVGQPDRRSRAAQRLALVLVGLLGLPGRATAYEREEASGSPGTYLFWANRTISYSLNRRGATDQSLAEVSGAIKRAFFSWASPSCTDVAFRFAGHDAAERSNLMLSENELPDHKNLFIWHEDRWPPAGVQDPGLNEKIPAITTLIYDARSGMIADVDVDINGYNFYWTTSDDPTKAGMDVESVVAHEIGHLLGLAHSKEPEATMFATVAQSELKKRTLEKDDVAGVCFLYPFGGDTPVGTGEGTIRNEVQGGCQLAGRPAGTAMLWAPLGGLLGLLGFLALRRRGWLVAGR